MSHRERFIPPTDDELRRLEEAHIAKQKLVESRKALIAKTLRTQHTFDTRKHQLAKLDSSSGKKVWKRVRSNA